MKAEAANKAASGPAAEAGAEPTPRQPRWLRGLDLLGAACLAVMVLLVAGNVLLRYVFNSGITVSEELARWLFVWLTFLGAIAALAEQGHMGSDLLLDRLGPRSRRWLALAGTLLMLGTSVLLLQGAWLQTRINWDVQAPVSGASMAWFYASGLVFAACAIACLLLQLRKQWRGQALAPSADVLKEV